MTLLRYKELHQGAHDDEGDGDNDDDVTFNHTHTHTLFKQKKVLLSLTKDAT